MVEKLRQRPKLGELLSLTQSFFVQNFARGDHIRKDKSRRIGLPEESEAVSIHERNVREPYPAAWIPK
jgi:hypothetical protein